MTVYRDSDGVMLVAMPADGVPELLRPSYLIRPGDDAAGPKELGAWLKFVPSDYEEVGRPYPDAVRELIGQVESKPPYKPLKPAD